MAFDNNRGIALSGYYIAVTTEFPSSIEFILVAVLLES